MKLSLATALPGAFRKLDPRHLARNPVMFVVFLGSIVTTVLSIANPSRSALAVTTSRARPPGTSVSSGSSCSGDSSSFD